MTDEDIIRRVSAAAKTRKKVTNISRGKREPNEAQKKKLLLAFLEGMERSLLEEKKEGS